MSCIDVGLEESFNQAIQKYGDMVYRIAMNQMKNKEDADDVFQEVFIKWMKHRDKFETEEYEKAWLIRVTINQCKSLHLSSWNQKTTGISEEMENSLGYEQEMEEEDEISSVLKKLPDKYPSVIHLFYYEEMSIAEIAKVLNQRESTIRTQLTRARKQLKSILKGVEL